MATSLAVALALGLSAHLVGTPLGHDGSWRDLLALVADIATVAILIKRGDLRPSQLLRSGPRCLAIGTAAICVAAALLAAERAPNALWDLTVSTAVLALTALVVAVVLVLIAERAARAAVRAIVALIGWAPPVTANVGVGSQAARRRAHRSLHALERYRSCSRRGPP